MKVTEDFWRMRISNLKVLRLNEECIAEIEKEAVANNPTAMFLMGRYYQLLDRKEDSQKVEDWMTKAVQAG